MTKVAARTAGVAKRRVMDSLLDLGATAKAAAERRRLGMGAWSLEQYLEAMDLRWSMAGVTLREAPLRYLDRWQSFLVWKARPRPIRHHSPAMQVCMTYELRRQKWVESVERMAIVRALVWMLDGDDADALATIEVAKRIGVGMMREGMSDGDSDHDSGDSGGSLPRRISLAAAPA